MGVWQLYRSLNAEQKQILHDKKIEVTRPVDEIIALLQPVAACDAAGAGVTKWGCLSIVGIVVGFVLMAFNPIPLAVRLILMVVLIAAGIFGIVFWIWASRVDVSDNLRGFVLPLLRLFREDIDRTQPLHLRMDLRDATDKAKKQSIGKPYSKGAYYKIIDTIYLDPWLDADAVFADGSRVHWAVSDTVTKHDKSKKAGGKYKTKTKYSRKSAIDVEMTLRKKEYAVESVADAKVKQGERSTTVKVSNTIKTKDLKPLPVRAMIDAMAGVYSSAQPAK